ncbi:MAG: IS5 family transposase [Nitrospira sp.]|nr:MAG: IS5 family transposase [Nitrospira sp.]
MRGDDSQSGSMFSYVPLEKRIPRDHPLRPLRGMVDEALRGLSPRLSALYAKTGRPSIPPERLLRALLIQILHSVRSERMLMEQLEYNLLFRWFVGLGMDDPVWDVTVFTKNRDRLLAGDVAQAFFDEILEQAREKRLLSTDHFTVDGTLVEAWASHKSFVAKERTKRDRGDDDPGNPTVDFRGEKRSNETHQSKTDPDARLARKGQETRLAYQGHVLMENRNGLVVDVRLTQASGYAEREAALAMIDSVPGRRRITLGADRGYDVAAFIEALRDRHVTPHVAQYRNRQRSAIDRRTTQHPGYAASQRKRKRVEEIFGWMKTIGLARKTRFRGTARVGWMFQLTAAAYNLMRMRNLIGAPT